MPDNKIKLVRITTVPLSLKYLLPGQMTYMREHGFDVTMMSSDGPEVAGVIAEEKCAFHALPLTRTISPLNDLKCIYHLYKWLKKNKPTIIHSETPKAGLVAMISGWLAGVPVRINTVAGLPLMVENGYKYFILAAVERITNAAATNVWPNSFSLQKIMLEKKLCKAGKMQVLANGSSNGTNTNRYSREALDPVKMQAIKENIHYNEYLHYNLCVARVVKDKGITELVEAFKALYNRDQSQRLLLVGPYEKHLDPLPQSTIELIENHPGIIRVPMTDAVEYYLALAQLFVFASYREGFPNVLMEAGSMGIPVICSRIEGNVDLIKHGETGLLFEKMNSNDLLEKWLIILADKTRAQQMAAKLQAVVRRNFDREVIWKAMHAAYLQLAVKQH